MAQDNGGIRGGRLDKQTRKIFIGGLNYNTTEDTLKSHFSQYGELVDVVVMKFPDTKRSRGFGFVTFATEDQVDACQMARPHTIDAKTVETKRATPREEFGKPEAGQTVKKVFVGGLKEDATDEALQTYFSQFGKVVEVTRLTEKDTGKKRGFGFVEFDDYDPVDKCILKGVHTINGRRVDVKKAISKQELNSMGGPMNTRGGGGFRGMRGGAGGPNRNHQQHNNYHQVGGNWGQGQGDQWGNDCNDDWGGPSHSNDGQGWYGDNQGGWSGGGGQSWDSGRGGGGSWGSNKSFGRGYGSDGYGSGNGGYSGGGGGPMRQSTGGSRGGYRQSPYGGGGSGRGFRGGGRGFQRQ